MFEQLEQLEQEVKEAERQYIVAKAENDQVQKQIDELRSENSKILKILELSVGGVDFVEEIAHVERNNVKSQVEDTITQALRFVYGEDFSSEFDYKMRAGKTSVDINCIKQVEDGVPVVRDIDGNGGGVADTMAFPMKLMVLMSCEEADKVLFCDEPGKCLDVDFGRVEKFMLFMRELCERLGIQIIYSSHHSAAVDCADIVYEMDITRGNISSARRVK